MANRRKRGKLSKKHKTPWASVILVGIVVTVLMCSAWFTSSSLNKKLDSYHLKETSLEQQIVEEQARAEEIKEYAKYVQTDAFVEAIAKEKLGLVFEDEIIFKAED